MKTGSAYCSVLIHYIAEILAIIIKQNTDIKVFAVMVRNSENKLSQIAADTPLLLGG